MTSESANPVVRPLEAAPSGKLAERVAAVAEVLVAFAAVHVAYRSFKHFTELGQAEGAAGMNFSPGIVMTLFTVVILLLCRRNFEQYGLSLARWRYNLNVGLVWGVVYVRSTRPTSNDLFSRPAANPSVRRFSSGC
jgi:hypothetical protein